MPDVIRGAGGVLFDKNGKVLVIKENESNLSYGKKIGMFSLPMGLIEPNEDPERAACREFEEETGYKVKTTAFLGCFPVFSAAEVSIFLMERIDGANFKESPPIKPLNPRWIEIKSLLKRKLVRPPTKEAVKRALATIVAKK